MATKNYMINDKWLDLDKQNIVELQSVDGVLDSMKVNGSEFVTPSGKITITENGTDFDIAQYALADVNVEGGGGSSDTITVTMSFTRDPDGLDVIVAKTTGLELATITPTPQEFELVGSGSALISPYGMYNNVTGAEPYQDTDLLTVIDGATVVFS